MTLSLYEKVVLPVHTVLSYGEPQLDKQAEEGAVHHTGLVTHQELLVTQVVRQRLKHRDGYSSDSQIETKT